MIRIARFRMDLPSGAAIGALALALGGTASADETAGCPLASESAGVVAEVLDGETVVLEDGARIRLLNALAPRPPPAGRKAEAEFAEKARERLKDLALGSAVRIAGGGRSADRHGRLHAHLFREDGLWLQGALVDAGLARVYSFADSRACVGALLASEAAARADRRGLWGSAAGEILPAEPPDRALADVGRFAIVEGEVLTVGERRLRTYLNFGTYWNVDFTVIITGRDRDRIAEAGMDLGSLAGRMVRVRGWLFSDRGPAVAVTHPEQIEIVGEN